MQLPLAWRVYTVDVHHLFVDVCADSSVHRREVTTRARLTGGDLLDRVRSLAVVVHDVVAKLDAWTK